MSRPPPDTSRARRPGRPAADAGDDLRARLVEQALQAFATHGIAATRLADVARAAGTSPALVSYYFGGREGLVAAVVEERLRAPMQSLVAGLRGDGGHAALERLRRFAERYVETVSREPWLPRLIAREVLSEGGSLREAFAERFAQVVFGGIAEVIAAAQAEGALRRDLAPPELALGLMSLLVFPFLAGPVIAAATGLAPERDPARLAATRWALFLDGARAASPPRATP